MVPRDLGRILPVIVTGVAGTGAVGSVSVVAEASVPETGLSSTGGVGSVTVLAAANTAVTGLTSTGSVDSVTATGTATVSPSGICWHRCAQLWYGSR